MGTDELCVTMAGTPSPELSGRPPAPWLVFCCGSEPLQAVVVAKSVVAVSSYVHASVARF